MNWICILAEISPFSRFALAFNCESRFDLWVFDFSIRNLEFACVDVTFGATCLDLQITQYRMGKNINFHPHFEVDLGKKKMGRKR